MSTITLDASALPSFGDASEDSAFVVITSLELAPRFEVTPGDKYDRAEVLACDGAEDFAALLDDRIPERAHVLVVLPNVYFKSPPPEQLGNRKLGVMACSSTPTSLEAIVHFLRMGARTDPRRQEQMAEDFFARGEAAERFRFVDEERGTVAEFAHLNDELWWHEQGGYLGWGDQQLFPSGEISVLPVSVFGQNIDTTFDLNGQLCLEGHPVLHSGTPSFLLEDQERIFRCLSTLQDSPVIATVEHGKIADLRATAPASEPAADMLSAMCDVDSRYRSVLELGFGINTGLELFPGNSAMNEVYGGRQGAVHIGLGLIPYTQYHLDLICPSTRVVGSRGEHIFGGS